MFGVITVNEDELRIKDYKTYRAFYCGMCRSLNKGFGLKGRITLSYDLTFMAIVLSSLYEDEPARMKKRCIVHPFCKHEEIRNSYSDYAAAMNITLTYYKLLDNWKDERKFFSRTGARLLKRSVRKCRRAYPKQVRVIEDYIEKLCETENNNSGNIDEVSTQTGQMLAELFSYKHDEWEKELWRLGMYLGKFIYTMDAYLDIEEDIKKNNFNPLKTLHDREDFKDECKRILTIMAAEATKAFERLPIVENAEIIRNILYCGIWNRFERDKTNV